MWMEECVQLNSTNFLWVIPEILFYCQAFHADNKGSLLNNSTKSHWKSIMNPKLTFEALKFVQNLCYLQVHAYHWKYNLLPHKMYSMPHFMIALFNHSALDQTRVPVQDQTCFEATTSSPCFNKPSTTALVAAIPESKILNDKFCSIWASSFI